MPAGTIEKANETAWGEAPPSSGSGWAKTGKKRPVFGTGGMGGSPQRYEFEWTRIVHRPLEGSDTAGPKIEGVPSDAVAKEYAPLTGEFRGALQDLVKDPTQSRQQAQYRLGRNVGAQAAELQRAATRGGAAGRGGGTGVVTAPAAEMAVRGQQEIETQMYDRQVQNMAALGQTLAQTVQSDLAVRGFDQQTSANAINIMQNALGLVAERLSDPDMHLVVGEAYNRYKQDLLKGVSPVDAAMTFSITLQSGTPEQQTDYA